MRLRSVILVFSFFAYCVPLASAETSVGPALQRGDPVQITQSRHGSKDVLLGGTFVNRGQQPIVAYRVGWAIVKDGKASLVEGLWMNVPAGVSAGESAEIPDQAIHFDTSARAYLFYIAEVTYADGTQWTAATAPLIDQAESHASSAKADSDRQ